MIKSEKSNDASRRVSSGDEDGGETPDRAAADGIAPLEVMLKAMRNHADAEKWDDTAAIAKHAAPCIHPHLLSIDMTGTNGNVIYDVSNTSILAT